MQAAQKLLFVTLPRRLTPLRANGGIVGAGFGDGAIAPVVGGMGGLFFRCGGGEFLGQGRNKHGFGAKMFAEKGLAHGYAFS